MKNEQVMKDFICRRNSRTLNLRSNGDELINYDTVIAYFKDGICFVNTRKYSSSTSTIQNKLKKILSNNHIQTREYESTEQFYKY